MRAFFVLVCIWILMAGAGLAASPMVEAFQAYSAALAKGDVATANSEGEKAWKAAEKAGNAKYSAILAYNLAELRLRYLPKTDAVTPAARAYTLAQASPDGGLAPASARVLAAATRYVSAPGRSSRTALDQALKAFDASGLEMTYPEFRAHLDLLKYAAKRSNWRVLRQHALAAQKAYAAMQMDNKPLLASLKIYAAVALLRQLKYKKPEPVLDELQDVFKLMGPQPYDHINQQVLNAMTWFYAARILHRTIDSMQVVGVYTGHIKKKYHESRKRNYHWPEITGRAKDCSPIEWVKQEAPKYPSDMAKQGYVGAVLVGYSLGEDGIPYDIRVLAQVPDTTFGNVSAQSVRKWRAKPLPGVPLSCREKLVTPFRFILE